MFAAFGIARQVHELLWYLDEARKRAPDPALDAEWARLVDADLAARDVDAARERVGELLRAASERLRAQDDPEHDMSQGTTAVPTRRGETPPSPPRKGRLAVTGTGTRRRENGDSPSRKRRLAGAGSDLSRADLVGVRWPDADLRRASLRGALLLGADLRGADLRLADLLGADLRGADLRGADLSTSLFLTPMQAAAARGDAATRLPAAGAPPRPLARKGPTMTKRRDTPPPRTGAGERETLLGFLDYLRTSVAAKPEGAPEPQVRTAAVPSGTNLLGLVKHLAHVERFVFLGEKPASWPATFRPEPEESVADVVAAYRACGRPRERGHRGHHRPRRPAPAGRPVVALGVDPHDRGDRQARGPRRHPARAHRRRHRPLSAITERRPPVSPPLVAGTGPRHAKTTDVTPSPRGRGCCRARRAGCAPQLSPF